MFFSSLKGRRGQKFMEAAFKKDRLMMSWTVNRAEDMEWCLRQNFPDSGPGNPPFKTTRDVRRIDGIITDEPGRFLEICKRWEDGLGRKMTIAIKERAVVDQLRDAFTLLAFSVLVRFFFFLNWRRGRLDYLTKSSSI